MKNHQLINAATLLTATALAFLSMSPAHVMADEYGRSGDDMMMGKHSMGATVETIDHKTGFMKLKSGMGDMTIHYPPPSIKDLKKGDKITVNLSYSKEGERMKDEGMMMSK